MSEPTAPHVTSMVVWDVSSPASVGRPVTAKIGVRCAVGCSLAGYEVEVRDAGRLAADARSAPRRLTAPTVSTGRN
jgi:hypothetical protein